jgi:hypothetical protein
MQNRLIFCDEANIIIAYNKTRIWAVDAKA